jgi:RNA polymerase sigma-70 factor (ECF subfamily)
LACKGGTMSDVCMARKKHKQEEEQQLIEKALAGDEAAFAILYNRYYRQVYAFCSRLLRGKFDVEDAVQQVFLEAWRSMSRFEGRSLFSTWLTKIAIHTCLSFHRKAGRILLNSNDDVDPYDHVTELLWGPAQNIPEEEVFLSERKAMVNKLLSRMTPKKKVVFMMSDMQGMTAPEISSVLKIPDATVRTRLFHARREFALWVSKNKSYRQALVAD